MRYFKPEEDDFDDDDHKKFFDRDGGEDDFGDEDDDDYFASSKEYKMAELSLMEANLNRRILISVVKMLEKSFLWKFYTVNTKLAMIAIAYRLFSNLIVEE